MVPLIGTGFGGRVQIPGFLKIAGVEIAGVMSTGRRETAIQVAADFKINRVCESYDELLQLPGLDAVSIVTPPYQHFDLTMRAFEAGKHVLTRNQWLPTRKKPGKCWKPAALPAWWG